MIYEVNLPSPSTEILLYCAEFSKKSEIDHSSIKRMTDVCGTTHNVVSGVFVSDETLMSLVRNQYSKFFKNMVPMLGILENTNKNILGCYPPHTDKSRYVTLNYYLELGGIDVKTVFYNKCNYFPTNVGKNIFSYNEVTPVSEHLFDKDKWYCMDTRQCHSVENILSKRIMLSISFFIPFTIFIKNNSRLINKIWRPIPDSNRCERDENPLS